MVDFILLCGSCRVKILTTIKFSTFIDYFVVAMATVIFSQISLVSMATKTYLRV